MTGGDSPAFTLTVGRTPTPAAITPASAYFSKNTGGNDPVFSLTVTDTSFIPEYRLSLSTAGLHSFPSAEGGYREQPALTVTVTNTGTQSLRNLKAHLSQADADAFLISPVGENTLARGETATFTVRPKTGLTAGSYSAVVSVDAAPTDVLEAFFRVEFTVRPSPTAGTPSYRCRSGSSPPSPC
ncbi:MAG: hypothetical protein FWE80_04720 [Oscillospiraceae bacterium]|nr:hypothetical protein [Oscillospiraceae bacterium]